MKKVHKVLVVDDVHKNLQIVGNILVNEGIKPGFATSGKNALLTVEKNRPDLILLDISMPEMDGYEVCKTLKSSKDTKDIPIIFRTPRTQLDEIIKGFDLGAVDYITKPFNAGELIRRIKTHLELKESQRIIEKQNIELKKLNDSKDRLFSIIAHDLRGPVGSFHSMIEILLSMGNDMDNDSKEEILKLLSDNAGSMLSLLENLFNWSKSQQNTHKIKPEKFRLKSLFDENIRLLNTNAQKKNITLTSECNIETQVFADKNMISTVIRNLISNSIKFTPSGGKINIEAKQSEKSTRILVIDNGVGIPKEKLSTLFSSEDFYSTYGTDSEKGSGLGLRLCSDFIAKNHGEISVESEEGKGSTFSFILQNESWQ